MGLFDFFRKPKATRTPTPPSRTVPRSTCVRFDDDAISCTRTNGLTETVRWSELRVVLIQTTAEGPAADDFFWVLVGREGGCVVPSEAEGCDRLLERLQQLPGFDNKAVILASQCVEEQTFLCWQRPAASEAGPPPARGN